MQEENSELLRDFSVRLERSASAAGKSQAEIADHLKHKGTGRVNNWFKARNFPRSAERPALASLLDVRSEWLFFGHGEAKKYSDDATVNEALARYGVELRQVPVISWSHAGQATVYEELPAFFQGKISTNSRDPRAFGLTVEGDSMEPKVFAGDRVVCEPNTPLVNGRPVVAKHANEEVQLRIYHKLPSGKIRLAPLNPVYPTIEYDPAAFHWIYTVKELVRAFF